MTTLCSKRQLQGQRRVPGSDTGCKTTGYSASHSAESEIGVFVVVVIISHSLLLAQSAPADRARTTCHWYRESGFKDCHKIDSMGSLWPVA